MLQDGSYPPYLKARIRSDNGHLGNHQTATFLAEVVNEKLSHICLAHLSKNNNTPEKALQSLRQKLVEKGVDVSGKLKLMVLNRSLPTEMLKLSEWPNT
jgi:phosphoribosyl 1,2-cyclic phosphodiesterase